MLGNAVVITSERGPGRLRGRSGFASRAQAWKGVLTSGMSQLSAPIPPVGGLRRCVHR
jgi:hypothetical protein